MTIQECIDRVDSLKPNQYTIKEKVEWLSFIELRIINDVLKTHEGYDGRYDLFTGYSEDKLTITMIAPSPYDRLYTKYLEMKIDEANGETTRYNNSATMFNTYYADYKKYYNKGHMPLDPLGKGDKKVPITAQVGLTDAEYDSLVKELTYNLTEYFSDRLSDDKIYEIVNAFVLNNIQMLKGKDGRDGIDGKDGYTPRKNVDYFDGKKGDNGDPGYTPQRGIDYFTDADKEAIKKYTDDVAERKFATAESKDNKMAFWDEDRISIETYPSSVAVIEIAGKIADDRIEAAIGTANAELESILAGGVD